MAGIAVAEITERTGTTLPPSGRGARSSLSNRYWTWRLYHFLIADAVTEQRPTKYKFVYEFLGSDLGRIADIGCGPGVFIRYVCRNAKFVFAADVNRASLGRTFA